MVIIDELCINHGVFEHIVKMKSLMNTNTFSEDGAEAMRHEVIH